LSLAQSQLSYPFRRGETYLKCKNEAKAFYYATLSANQGNDNGRYELGKCLVGGVGCEKDEDRAIEIYTLASEGKVGLTTAMFNLSNMDRSCRPDPRHLHYLSNMSQSRSG
jgi:TPR repeat protein